MVAGVVSAPVATASGSFSDGEQEYATVARARTAKTARIGCLLKPGPTKYTCYGLVGCFLLRAVSAVAIRSAAVLSASSIAPDCSATTCWAVVTKPVATWTA